MSNAADPFPPDFIVTSPCVGVCTVDPESKMCIGCLRTLKEIGSWRLMSLEEKREVLVNCRERAKITPPRDQL